MAEIDSDQVSLFRKSDKSGKAAEEIRKQLKSIEPAFTEIANVMDKASQKSADTSKASADSQISDIDRIIKKYNELNTVKLTGSGYVSSGASGLQSLADQITKGDDT